MATAVRFQEGCYIDYTPGSAVAAGDVVVVGTLVGIADEAIDANRKGALAISGVYKIAKEATATEFAAGAAVYWDAADGECNTDSGNPFIGKAIAAAAATDTHVYVVLLTAQAAVAEALGLANLSDIGSATPTAGNLMIGDGDSFETQAITGPFTLSAAGVIGMKVDAVAATGSAQGDAAAVAEGFTHATDADATKGVKLPTAAAGKVCLIKNSDAANAVLKVYPDTDDAINALSADAALSMAAKTSALFVALDATTWYTLPLLPS